MKDNAREKLVNPWLGMDYEERLEAAKAVDQSKVIFTLSFLLKQIIC